MVSFRVFTLPPLLLLLVVCLSHTPRAAAMRKNFCTAEGSTVGAIGEKKRDARRLVKKRPFEITNHCRPNWRCRSKAAKKCDHERTICRKRPGHWHCEKTCLEGQRVKCKRLSGGRGDPHMTGFDGKPFDFHGRADAYFMLFGRHGGDALVARMRAFERRVAEKPVDGTLFSEFGLNVGETGDRVHVRMERSGDATAAAQQPWRLVVDANDCALTGDTKAPGLSVKFANDKRIELRTRDTWFNVLLVQRTGSPQEAHLNIDIELQNGGDSAQDLTVGAPPPVFLGVLGMSLNRDMGHTLRAELGDVDVGNREQAMSSVFEVDSLFPSDATASGVVRVGVASRPRDVGAGTASSVDK